MEITGTLVIDILKILSPILAISIFIWKCSSWYHSFSTDFNELKNSVSIIKTAIVEVDLKTMERQLSMLLGATSKTYGNTVETTLKGSGVGVAISLISFDKKSKIEIRFDQPIEIEGLQQNISNDKILAKEEKRLFGKETDLIAYSPRAIQFQIPSNDLDKIAEFTTIALKSLDYSLQNINSFEQQFDEKLERKLGLL
jgi:hypothetical protein